MAEYTFRTDTDLAVMSPADRSRTLAVAAGFVAQGMKVLGGPTFDETICADLLGAAFRAARTSVEATDDFSASDREVLAEAASAMVVVGMLLLVGRTVNEETADRLTAALLVVAHPEIEPDEWEKAAADVARHLSRIEVLHAEAMALSKRARVALRRGRAKVRFLEGIEDKRASRRRGVA